MSAKKPKSAIDIVLGRLPSDILARLLGSPSPHDPAALRRRAALVSDGDEALRLLRARHAKLAPKGETQMARAALVVEYLGRNAPDDDAGGRYFRTTVPVAVLAKAAGFPQKKDTKKLERMQTVMASYLDGTSMGRKSGRGGGQRGRKRDASSLKPAAMESSSSAASRQTLPPSELVRDLCIRLGPAIPDAEYAMAYAMGLLEALVNADGIERQSHATASKRRRFSKYELRKDMERHKEYYEAACFFLAVKKSEGENSQLLLKKPAKKTAAKTKKDDKKPSVEEERGEEDAAEEEEEVDEIEEKTLSEADVVAAANLLEGTFRTVLQYVRDWTEGMTIDTTRRGAGGDGLSGGPKEALFEVADKGDAGADKSKSEPIESAFDQWKRKVLQDAKASVVSKMGSNESGDWLSIAADEVLRKAGL